MKKKTKNAIVSDKFTTFTTFAEKYSESRLHLGKTQIKFGFSLGLHYLCIHNTFIEVI